MSCKGLNVYPPLNAELGDINFEVPLASHSDFVEVDALFIGSSKRAAGAAIQGPLISERRDFLWRESALFSIRLNRMKSGIVLSNPARDNDPFSAGRTIRMRVIDIP